MLKPKKTIRKELINIVYPYKYWCNPRLIGNGRFTYWKTQKGVEVLQSNENILKPKDLILKPASQSIGYIIISDGKIVINGMDKIYQIKTDATT